MVVTFSEEFRKMREAKGLSQEALSVEIGVSRKSIQDYESGASLPRRSKAAAIAKALSVDKKVIDSLLQRERKDKTINKCETCQKLRDENHELKEKNLSLQLESHKLVTKLKQQLRETRRRIACGYYSDYDSSGLALLILETLEDYRQNPNPEWEERSFLLLALREWSGWKLTSYEEFFSSEGEKDEEELAFGNFKHTENEALRIRTELMQYEHPGLRYSVDKPPKARAEETGAELKRKEKTRPPQGPGN